jgi:hypothetical protein
MAEVDHAAQRNASAAEQLTATAAQMADQAERLERLMDFFKGKGQAGQANDVIKGRAVPDNDAFATPWQEEAKAAAPLPGSRSTTRNRVETGTRLAQSRPKATTEHDMFGQTREQFTRF